DVRLEPCPLLHAVSRQTGASLGRLKIPGSRIRVCLRSCGQLEASQITSGGMRMWHLKGSLKRVATTGLVFLASVSLVLPTIPLVNGADHAEATLVAGDPQADIADVFAFLDPNHNSQVVLAMDVEGFVVPSELLNLSFFAPDVTYRFEIENTGDAIADQFIDV